MCLLYLSLLIVSQTFAFEDQVKVKPGENVTLQCRAPRDATIKLVKWIRPDLNSDGFVFYYRENRSYERYQHQCFHGRVELKDPEMKDGDVSVILKNVSISDSGTYECWSADGGDPELLSNITLTLEPDEDKVKVRPGENATLYCQGPRDATIKLLEWRRPDLRADGYVFYRNDHPYENYQNLSFHGRVELKDPEMKDGNASLTLKNVTFKDTGRYECHIVMETTNCRKRGTELRHVISLKVEDTEGTSRGHIGWLAILPVVVVVVVVVIIIVGLKYKQRPNQNSFSSPTEVVTDC